MGENIIVSIITYNPEIERLRCNIESINNQIKTIVLIDNGSSNIEQIKELVKFFDLTLIQNLENEGIAKALNQALEYSHVNGFQWLLTLDQDSISDDKFMYNYYFFLEKNKRISNLALLTPKIIDRNLVCDNKSFEKEYNECFTAITSGSLINVEIAKRVGGFKNELFIDGVDFEFCLNLKSNGYRIFRINKAKLYHELGHIKVNKFLGAKFITTNHSALRRYYYFRNKIYITKKYYSKYKKWTIKYLFSGIKTLLFIIFFENNKINKLKFSLKGIYDGIFNNYGKYGGKI
ncbi:glycosyltransferase family 2 protein [Clostridium perfringens]|nr:glycosyltransferase family 2 protein [Clostridium perfringens]MDM0769770.1 glycosyltransferase family 2 protein [Clostridium perfringens]